MSRGEDRKCSLFCMPKRLEKHLLSSLAFLVRAVYVLVHRGSFALGIKMDTDAYEHRPEREVVDTADLQFLEMVVVQESIVQTLACGALFVDGVVLFCTTRDTGIEPQVAMVFNIDCPSIELSATALLFIRAGFNPSAPERAAVFMGILHRVIAPGYHFLIVTAERRPVFIESDIIRGIFRSFVPAVDVYERVDAPAVQKPVCGDVVMGTAWTDVFWQRCFVVCFEVVDGIQEIDAVMAAPRSKRKGQREVYFKRIVAAGQDVKVVPVEPCLLPAVIAPGSVRVIVVAHVLSILGWELPSERAVMGRDARAVPGQSERSSINQAGAYGWEDRCKEEDVLQGAFGIVRGAFPIHKGFGKRLCCKRSLWKSPWNRNYRL